ncbi:hypothetical protein Q7P37_008091 [Cladosporium fusiforme]
MGSAGSSPRNDSAQAQDGVLSLKSPMMRLPVELRLKIYRCYFEDSSNTREVPLSDLRIFLPLLQTNRLVRSEAAPMFYREYIANQELRNRLVLSTSLSGEDRIIKRIASFCSLISIYNPNAEFTTVFDSDSGHPDSVPLSRPFLETFLDLMALKARVDSRTLGIYKNMWLGSAPGSSWERFSFQGNIGNFTFEYNVGEVDDDGCLDQTGGAETFRIHGPLAKLDWRKVSDG